MADDRSLRQWGEQPRIRFFPAARIVAPALAAAAVATVALWMTGMTSLKPFLIVVVAEMAVGLALRTPVARVADAVETPSRELELLALLLQRLERESFASPALIRLRQSLEADGQPASRHIRRLTTLVYHFDSALANHPSSGPSPLRSSGCHSSPWRLKPGAFRMVRKSDSGWPPSESSRRCAPWPLLPL